jgi:methyl coenzyme M reductase alpha subunit
MWRSYCNMKTAAWNYDDLWLGSAFSNGVFNTTQLTNSYFFRGIGIPPTRIGDFIMYSLDYGN